jgi:hypothetical protein
MESSAVLSQDNAILKETAVRLVKALGVETAISICRSNYWHGVMQLILDQQAGFQPLGHNSRAASHDLSVRLHSLPPSTVQSYPQEVLIEELPLAA